MKYFIDTEFEEIGGHTPITLISIGIVAEDGRELYLENDEVVTSRLGEWLQKHVVPHLRGGPYRKNTFEIAEEIKAFIPPKLSDEDKTYCPPEFWGYFADYDWVVFCQLFGRMIDLPRGYPQFCYDLMQLSRHLGVPRHTFPKQEGFEHNALEDARWNKQLYDFLCDQIAKQRFQR